MKLPLSEIALAAARLTSLPSSLAPVAGSGATETVWPSGAVAGVLSTAKGEEEGEVEAAAIVIDRRCFALVVSFPCLCEGNWFSSTPDRSASTFFRRGRGRGRGKTGLGARAAWRRGRAPRRGGINSSFKIKVVF